MKTGIFLIILTILTGLCGCNGSGHGEKQAMKTIVVKAESLHKSLHFTGTIAPLRESSLTSPVDAVIERMTSRYGEMVHDNDVVVTLSSTELQRQYNETLTEYLKAKDSYRVAAAKFTGTENLWNAGLVSKNNFLSEKSNLDTARVTLMQATGKLMEMLEKTGDSDKDNLSRLSLAEFEKIRQILSGRHNQIHLKAPFSGVLLYPPKSNDDRGGHLTVGSSIKAGQVFALVGDLSGVRVEIDVPEIDIAAIHPGMKANVTGIALGRDVMQGEVTAVNAQATVNAGNTLPSFTAVVEVRTLNEHQRRRVKAGMSAAIELILNEDSKLRIPIAAVSLKNGSSEVQVQMPNGSIRSRQVVTGAAEADRVVIESGLNEGDVVVYGDQ